MNLERYDIKCIKCGLAQIVMNPILDSVECFHCGAVTHLEGPNPFRPIVDLCKEICKKEYEENTIHYCMVCHSACLGLEHLHKKDCQVLAAKRILYNFGLVHMDKIVGDV